jgi:hypothetical protein
MTKAIVKKACALKRDSASDKLLRNVLDDICNKLDTAKKSSNNGKVPYGEAQKLVEEMQKILPKLNRNMVNYHLKKRESMATTTSDDEEPDLPGLDYGTDNEESDDEGNENTSIITTSPVLVEIFSNPTLPCPRQQLEEHQATVSQESTSTVNPSQLNLTTGFAGTCVNRIVAFVNHLQATTGVNQFEINRKRKATAIENINAGKRLTAGLLVAAGEFELGTCALQAIRKKAQL